MKLETALQIWIFCAAFEFSEGIVAKRIKAAEYPQAFRIQRRLGTVPIILSADFGVFIFDSPRRIPPAVSNREQESAPNAGLVEEGNYIRGREGLRFGGAGQD